MDSKFSERTRHAVEAALRGYHVLFDADGPGTKELIPVTNYSDADIAIQQRAIDLANRYKQGSSEESRTWRILEKDRRRRERDNKDPSDIFTLADAFRAAKALAIPEKVIYCRPGGVAGFQKILTFEKNGKRPYYVAWAEPEIIAHNANENNFHIPNGNYRMVIFGGGPGWKEREQIARTRKPVDIKNLDDSFEYGIMLEDNLAKSVTNKGKVNSLQVDFMYFGDNITNDNIFHTGNKTIWADANWNRKIRHPNDPTPIVFTMYGATLGNQPRAEIIRFLRNLATKMRTGDRTYIGVDSTQDIGVLTRAYTIEPFKKMAHDNFLFTYGRRIGLTGFDLNKINFVTEGSLNIFLEVQSNHPIPRVADPNSAWADVARDVAKSFRGGQRIRVIGSSRRIVNEWIEIFREGGLELGSRPNGAPGQPLRLEANSNEAFAAVNYNVYDLVKKLAA